MRLIARVISLIMFSLNALSMSVYADDKVETAPITNKTEINRLLNLTGSGKLGFQILNQVILSAKQTYPDASNDFWHEFMKEVDANEMQEIAMNIYAKHFTPDEIRDLIAFYETPTGQKLAHNLPLISRESMAASQQWGQKIITELDTKLKQKGLKE